MEELTIITETVTPENSEAFNEVFEGLEFFEQMGMGDLTEFLALEDTAFEQLKPIFLEELQLGLNNANDRYTLVAGLQQSGISLDQFKEGVDQTILAIEEQEILSRAKKDFLIEALNTTVNALQNTLGINRRIINIPLAILSPDAKMPTYAHDGDAGLDVYSMQDYDIAPGQSVRIPIGIAVAIPHGYELQVRPKSGLSAKSHLRIANAPGTIDSPYKDGIEIIVENNEAPIQDIEWQYLNDGKNIRILSILRGSPIHIDKGQKIAQLVLSEVPTAAFYVVDTVKDIGEDRGGGFGHSGK